MNATELGDPFRIALLSADKGDQALLVTRDAVAAKRERLDPYYNVKDELLLEKRRWYIPNDIHQQKNISRPIHPEVHSVQDVN